MAHLHAHVGELPGLRVLTDGGVRTRDLPLLAGVSRESVTSAAGLLVKTGLAVAEPGPAGSRYPITALTARGAAAQRDYRTRAAAVEAGLPGDRGPDLIAAARLLVAGGPPRLFEGLRPYPDGWRAQVAPLAVLPHYPVTLHRGGYPDGS